MVVVGCGWYLFLPHAFFEQEVVEGQLRLLCDDRQGHGGQVLRLERNKCGVGQGLMINAKISCLKEWRLVT